MVDLYRLTESGTQNKGVLRALALIFTLIGTAAQAGEVLHLKSATVDTRQLAVQSQALFATSVKAPSPGYFVVQFKGKIGSTERRDLISLGAKIMRYIPDDALVVKATGQQILSIQKSLSTIQAVVPYVSQWKIAPEFSPLSILSAKSREQILVRLFTGESLDTMVTQIQTIAGARVIESGGSSIVVEIPRVSVDAVSRLTGVEWVQPNPHFELFDAKLMDEPAAGGPSGDYTDLSGYESGHHLINVESAWEAGLTGKGQIASMADTGLDKGDIATIHQDFTGRIPTGLIFGIYSKTWQDPMGHGTHVSGSIVGSGAASSGKLRGGAYEAQYIPESMWSDMLGGLSVPTKLSDLFTQAYAAGARVHSNSWGSASSLGVYDGLSSQVDEFAASNPEMLVLFAAGNSGIDSTKTGRVGPNTISSPGTAKNCLTVGASKNLVLKGGYQMELKETRLKDNWPVEPLASSKLSENPQGLAAFSSRGPTQDGRLKPEIVAPGTNILSVRTQVAGAETLWGAYNNDYVWSGGTSMATPITASAATLVRQYLVENRKFANPSSALLKAVLIHSATDLFPGQFGEVGQDKGQEILTTRPNNDEGFGRVDLNKATHLDGAILVDERTGLATGDVKTYQLHVTGASHLTATLVFTDAAASESAKTALVNDLDLILVDPAGKQTSLNDHVNNSKMLQSAVAAGDYQILVKGDNVPQGLKDGKQPFALVMSLN